MLHVAEPFLERNLHPTVIVRGFRRALEDAVKVALSPHSCLVNARLAGVKRCLELLGVTAGAGMSFARVSARPEQWRPES